MRNKLCKGEKGCYLDIKCPRCGEVIHIEIGDVITTRIVSKEEREKVRAQMISQHKIPVDPNDKDTLEI